MYTITYTCSTPWISYNIRTCTFMYLMHIIYALWLEILMEVCECICLKKSTSVD